MSPISRGFLGRRRRAGGHPSRVPPGQHVTDDDTSWRGVSLDTLLETVQTEAEYLTAWCDGGYTTNLALEDVVDGEAWVDYEYEGGPVHPAHGGPARLLVPHLYFWKSAKWIRALTLTATDEPGFWETYGYHNHGDPWLGQRYQGD
jgi:DMSO/TMAO reductase YedYZ molybdopterin-dependent catalytic subunit